MKISRDMIIAGLATVGGLAIISKTPVMRREAETLVFNAKAFPKKIRLDQYMKFPSTPICKSFLNMTGDYFKFYDDEIEWRMIKFDLSYNDEIEKYFFKEPSSKDVIDIHKPEWFYYFNQKYNISSTDLAEKLEFWGGEYTLAKQQQIINKPINYSLISKQEFEQIWNDVANRKNLDRIDAYWELYTNGTIDSNMDDEPSPLYLNIRSIFKKLAEATFDNLKNPILLNEQQIYDLKMEALREEIDIEGWQFLSQNFNSYWKTKSIFGLNHRLFEENTYNLSNDEMTLLCEWIILRQYIIFYGLWNTNIKPLIDKGFDIDEGVIIENIRGTFDAYGNEIDKPSRYNQIIELPSKDFLVKNLFSELLITKQFVKKRLKFLQLNNKIFNLEQNKELLLKEQDEKNAIIEIKEIIANKNKLKEMAKYHDISEEDDADIEFYRRLYKENMNDNIQQLIVRAGDKMTDADRKLLKKEWKEYLEDVKYQKIQENKEEIEKLKKANDRIEAFIKDYGDEIDKMDLKG